MGFLTSCRPDAPTRPVLFMSEEAASDLMLDGFLDRLFREAREDDFSFSWSSYFTNDPDDLAYRRAVLEELDEQPRLVEKIRTLSRVLGQIRSVGEYSSAEDISGALRDFSVLRLAYDALTDLSGYLRHEIACGRVCSEGLSRLQSLCDEKLSGIFSKNFPAVWDDAAAGLEQAGSMLFRFSLNGELRTTGVSLCSVHKGRFSRGTVPASPAAHVGHLSAPWELSAPHEMMTPLKELISTQTSASGRLFLQSLRLITADMEDFRADLIFYLGALGYLRLLERLELPMSYPEIRPAEELAFEAEDMANPVLASLKETQPVTNSIAFEKGGEILVLTGINQGGKTTFLRTVGCLQALCQLGWPVPAESARISPVKNIVTVFSHEENTRLQHGKLGQELKTIRRGLDLTGPDSLVLFNEPVTGTSPMENLYLSREVLVSCKLSGLHGIWVTHLYDLAAEAPQMNEKLSGSRISSIRAVARHSKNGVEASYRIERGEPEFTSYAREVLSRKMNA